MTNNKYYTLLAKVLAEGKMQENKKGNIFYLLNERLTLSPADLLDIFEGHGIARKKLKNELQLFMQGERSVERYREAGINWWDYCGAYKCYWKLRDYLDVLSCLQDVNYIYFTSEKSQVIELCEWIRENPDLKDPFENAEMKVQNNKISYCAGFADIMLIKQNDCKLAS